ncbi:MAG TPA: hypothetical protein VMZ29_01085 [Candidatus Bathyarchaeia archaeon]|nr:hypothetical protein [Candidatus Bathyarchaeia archaeon]
MTYKNNNRRRSTGGGMSLVTILWIIFLILKLTHVIDWKWYWVFSPIWIAASLGLLFFIIIGMILLAAVVGIASHSSKAIVGIKNWFSKNAQENDIVDVDEK